MILPLCFLESEFLSIVDKSGFERTSTGTTFEPLYEKVDVWVHPKSKQWYIVRFSQENGMSFVACIELAGESFEQVD